MTVLDGYGQVCGIIEYGGDVIEILVPNRTEKTFPDGTVYRVSSTFVGKTEMGDMLDSLTIEKINREVA